MFNSKTKNLVKKLMCLVLSLSFLLPNATLTAFAQGFSDDEITSFESEYGVNLDFLTEEMDSSEVFNEMSAEAQAIFLQYMQAYDPELLEYHKTYVDTECNLEYEPPMIATYSTLTAALNTLDYQLTLIGLSSSVKYALMSVGSSMVAALADGPLPVGDIVALLVAAGCSVVLIANWGTISSKWTEISNAFQTAFNTLVSPSTVSSSFTQAKPTYANPYDVMTRVRTEVRYAYINPAAARHVAKTFVDNVTKTHSAVQVYIDHNYQTAMLVYRLSSNTVTNFNTGFDHLGSENSGVYQNQNQVIPAGAYVFVLYNLQQQMIFHAHVRFSYNDTEQYRRANRLCWTVYPIFLHEDYYDMYPTSSYLNGTIFW